MTHLQDMRPLTHAERIEARRTAAHLLAGKRPERMHDASMHAGKYPASVQRVVYALAALVLVAAFVPSAIRLYAAGSAAFMHGVQDDASARIVGIATIAIAEVGQLIFSLALALVADNAPARRVMYAGMTLATAIALVGNWTIAAPMSVAGGLMPFAVLEAAAPPLIVLGVGYVLKGRMLYAIEQRTAAQGAYVRALNAWQDALDHAEDHAQWGRYYVQSLKDSIARANNRGRAKEARAALNDAQWADLVLRELHADRAFAGLHDAAQRMQAAQDMQATAHASMHALPDHASAGDASMHVHASGANGANGAHASMHAYARPEPPNNAGARTGEFADAVEARGAAWVATCPYCGREFVKDAEQAARMALTAHKRGCKVAASEHGNDNS